MDVIRMPMSMTGFGQSKRMVNGYVTQMDVKSVNHRYNEIMIRMPREWVCFEDLLKKKVQQRVHRGRVDIFINVERQANAEMQVAIDWGLAEGYWQAAHQLRERFSGDDSMLSYKSLLQIPDVVTVREKSLEPDEKLQLQLEECLDEALDHLLQMRKTEGEHLYLDLIGRLELLRTYHSEMTRLAPEAVSEYRKRLRQRLNELLSDHQSFDEHRFTMEVALMAERSNIDEELTRLDSHIRQFHNMLQSSEPVGRKLDFLVQEMNREVNTIGSKSAHTDLVNKVVDIKSELEKIREQIQNIE
jgi:uncharacterized protein (TIGR00255 family)